MSAVSQPGETSSSALPSGTVTFAFTDVEGSTQRWEADRVAMADAVRRHDELMRAAIVAHGGHVFKTIGDAFCAAFARPENAVAAMLEAERALAAEDFSAAGELRVRAAVHTGTADERDGDYFGPAVNRVARLLAIGHGGQVLVSGVTADLVQGELPAGAGLRDLGEHRLRDLARPEQVYQVLAPGLGSEFPPLRSLDALPNNLPVQLTSFVGREKEIAEIAVLIAKHRLVTLVGTGGVGKTRTSLQVAANLLDGSGDGVWFVELAPLASGDYIAPAIAQTLGLALGTEGDPLENLVRALKPKHMLLVFDNCEHLVDPVARVVAAILNGCPKVNVLVSGRQALEIAGEETYRLPILEIPAPGGAPLRASDALQSAAIALFVDRALSVDKRFQLTDDNAPVVAEICRRLDGIPLAIELAASRVKMLSPKQLSQRLDERFRVLTGGSRNVLPRQQTLRALIDWSYDLLDERERALFRRLAIFVKSFTLEGAVAAGGGDDLDELDVFDVLASLVDKSLVLAEPDGDALRYRLLESTRAYALQKLDESGERNALAERHLRYLRDMFAGLRERAEETTQERDLDAPLAGELEDVRAALDFALSGTDVALGAELLAAIGRNWQYIGLEREGIARIENYLAALGSGEPLLAARLGTTLSEILRASGRKTRALEAASRAIPLARESSDGAALARALDAFAYTATTFGRPDEAEPYLVEAEAIEGLSRTTRLLLLWTRATMNVARNELEAGIRLYEQLRSEYRSAGNRAREGVVAGNLAEIEHARGQTRRAIAIIRETQAYTDMTGLGAQNVVGYYVAVDELSNAVEAARASREALTERDPDHVLIAVLIEHLAVARALQGAYARAATLEGYAAAAYKRHGFERETSEKMSYDRLFAILEDKLAADELERLLAEGAVLEPESAFTLALEDV